MIMRGAIGLSDHNVASANFGNRLAWAIALLLPLTAAVLYRTYDMVVAPESWELTRQFGMPFVLAEIAVYLYARRKGLDLRVQLEGLAPWLRWMLGLFLASYWVSSVFVSLRPAVSAAFALIWLVHLLFGASVFHLARGEFLNSRSWGAAFATGLATLVPVIAVHCLMLPPELVGHEREIDWGSALPGFISNRLFGAWVGAAASLLLGLIWTGEISGEKPRWLYPAFFLAATLLIWSGTRAAVLGVAIAALAAWGLTGKIPYQSLLTKFPPMVIVAAVVATLLVPYGHPAYYLYMPGDLAGSGDHFTSGRLTLWAESLKTFAEYPLFGTGLASSWWLIPVDKFYHIQPHNVLIQFLVNWGLAATISGLLLLGAAIWRVHAIAREAAALMPMVAMLDSLIVMSLFDGMLHFSRFVMLIFTCIALCLAQGRSVDRYRD